MSKFCIKCGAAIEEEYKCCKNCGYQVCTFAEPKEFVAVEDDSIANIDEIIRENAKLREMNTERKLEKNEPKKGAVIALSVVASVIVIAILSVVLFFVSPANTFTRKLKKGEFEKAKTTYDLKISDSNLQKSLLLKLLDGYNEGVVKDYYNGKADYDTVYQILQTMHHTGLWELEDEIKNVKADRESKDAFKKAGEYSDKGKYADAIKEYAKITKDNINYEEAQRKLKAIYPKYIDLIGAEVEEYIKNNSYETGLSVINTAIELLPENAEIFRLEDMRDRCINEYYLYIEKEVNEKIGEGKYSDAIELAEYAVTVVNNEAFKKLKDRVINDYISFVKSNVERLMANEDYKGALEATEESLKVLQDNEALMQLKATVIKDTPVFLLDECEAYTASYYTIYQGENYFKSAGNEYTNGFVLYDDGYAVFNVDGKYTELSFITGHIDDAASAGGTVRIYCDGVLTREIKMGYEDLPQEVSVDISGTRQLKFELESENLWGTNYGLGKIQVKKG